MIAPSDTYKKRLHNCTMAIQYIKQAGFPLSDADGLSISAEDIVNGDKELILALLWNMFIYMQVNLNSFRITFLFSNFTFVVVHIFIFPKDLKFWSMDCLMFNSRFKTHYIDHSTATESLNNT